MLWRIKQSLEKNLKILKAKALIISKRENHQKFKPINDIFYFWFKKFEASYIYVNGPLLKEEPINITQSLSLQLDGFKALEGYLDKWKLSHAIKEKKVSSEFLKVSETAVMYYLFIITFISQKME